MENGQISTARWSPDEATILTAGEDGKARLWDVSTKISRTVSGHDNSILQATWSQDGGSLLTASMDDTARVWDAQTGKQLHKLAHTDDVTQGLLEPERKPHLYRQR